MKDPISLDLLWREGGSIDTGEGQGDDSDTAIEWDEWRYDTLINKVAGPIAIHLNVSFR